MNPQPSSRIAQLLQEHEADILTEWVDEQLKVLAGQRLSLSQADLRAESAEFVGLLRRATAGGDLSDSGRPEWKELSAMLARLSQTRARHGFSPPQTASFVFSFKRPLFGQLRREYEKNPDKLAQEMWTATELLDRLGLQTVEAALRNREEVVSRQQEEMLELSTPVVKLWDGILALPMIGTLDSARTQVVMETLLQRIVETGAEVAIIDITGVPTVDTLVAQHLLKTVNAARLMGAECIISGIRPQIAQTIVHLGVELGDVSTKATLADAFAVALHRRGLMVAPGQRR